MTRAQPAAIVGSETPQRIQRRRTKGWRMPPNTICITRPGPWGNPFVVGRDGTQAECVELYARLLGGLLCVSAKASLNDQQAARSHVLGHIKVFPDGSVRDE